MSEHEVNEGAVDSTHGAGGDFEYSGNFSQDYEAACKKLGIPGWRVLKIGYPLPPLPYIDVPPTSVASTTAEETSTMEEAFSPTLEVTAPPTRYRFTPTINVEYGPSTVDEEQNHVPYKISFRGHIVTDEVMEMIYMIVPNCPSITTISFWNCGLQDTHLQHITALLLNTDIHTLHIDGNPLITEDSYAELLSDESPLKHLSIRSARMTDKGAKALAAQLKVNHTLISLDLWGNQLGRESASAFADALKENDVLVSLDLGNNNIQDAGSQALAKVLANIPMTLEEQNARKRLITEKLKEESAAEDSGKKGAGGSKPKAAGAKERPNSGGKKNAVEEVKKGAKLPASESKGAQANSKKPAPVPAKPTAAKDDKKATGSPKKPEAKKPLTPKGKKKDDDDSGDDVVDNCTFELNGQWYMLGNRSLLSLNLSKNGITDIGLKALFDAVTEQEATQEYSGDGTIGLYRLCLTANPFESQSMHQSIIDITSSRNVYVEKVQ